MKPVLILIRPLDKQTGQRVDIRIGDGGSADDFGVGGGVWEPALGTRPTMSIELMSPDMDGKVQAGRSRFDIMLAQIRAHANPRALYWRGAAVTIHSTGTLEGPTAVPDFVGYITGARHNFDAGIVSIDAEVSTTLIDKPLLTKEFDGGGGLGGDPEKRGVLWPTGFGAVNNLEPVWFDTVRNIGMVDGYGNTTAIDWLGEGLSSFGAPVDNYANYAALAAAVDAKTIPPGRWGVSVQPGQPSLVALGAPPTGVITVRARFGYGLLGAMMRRILEGYALVPADRLDGPAFNALDAAVPYPVHYWTAEQRNTKDLLEALAQSCNATPLVSFQGKVTVTRAVASAPIATLDRSGSVEPRVLDWQSADVDAPFYVLKARTARPPRVLSLEEVNYVDTIIDRGLFNVGTTYRAGNVVWLKDGSQWLYIGATPGSGVVPDDAVPDVWQNLQPRTTASDIVYDVTGETVKQVVDQSIVDQMLYNQRFITYRLETDQILFDPQTGETIRSIVDRVGIKADNADAYVEERRTVSSNGNAYASLIVASGQGGTVSVVNEATGEIGVLRISADGLEITDPNGGNPRPILTYGADNRLILDDVYIRLLEVGAVKTASLAQSAVQKTNYTILQNDVACPVNQNTLVMTVAFTKAEPDSNIRVQASCYLWSVDDLQFNPSFVLDDGTAYSAGQQNIKFSEANSAGKMSIAPALYIPGIGVGNHTIKFYVQNVEGTGDLLTAKANSFLEVIEVKKGAL